MMWVLVVALAMASALILRGFGLVLIAVERCIRMLVVMPMAVGRRFAMMFHAWVTERICHSYNLSRCGDSATRAGL
jgi:hypothetical protein